MSQCKTCHTEIVWAVTTKGKMMPVDADPVEGGNLILIYSRYPEAAPLVRFPTHSERQLEERASAGRGEPLRLHISHFATCADADEHRKQKEEA